MQSEPLSMADAVRYHMSTPLNPMEIGVVLFLRDRMTWPELERFVIDRLLSHTRFRQSVVLAPFPLRPSWRDEAHFSLASHVSELAGPALSDARLAQQLAERLSQRLPYGRSPWRLELFPLEGERSALHLRVQHCLGDGLSLVKLLCELADEPQPAAPGPDPRRAFAQRRLPTPRRALRQMSEFGRTLGDTLLSRADRARDLHHPCGRKAVAWSGPVALEPLSRLASERGHHLTELLLGACADALAHDLAAQGHDVPPRLRALVPTGASLGRRELGNHYASTFVELVLDEPDAWRRVARISETTAKLHDAGHARMARALIGLAGWLSPPLMRTAVDFMSRRASLTVSNVPGPGEHARLLGHEVDSIVVFAPPAASIGISFTLFGYAGSLRLGVETDAAIPLSPATLVQRFERGLHELATTR